MDPQDQADIIKKVKTEGQDNSDVVGDDGDNVGGGNTSDDEVDVEADFEEEEVNEDDISIYEESEVEKLNPELYPKGWKEMDGIFMNPKKNNMFQPGSNDILTDKISEGFDISEKKSIFTSKIKNMIRESLNQETIEAPVVEPQTKPVEKPETLPSRRNKPFLPTPEADPDPKAKK